MADNRYMFIAELMVAGIAIGVVFGIFGAGGSAFATPVLALLGVPGAIAVASPLPAMLPAAVTGARRYLRSGNLDRRIAGLAITGGLPGTLLGALASQWLSGTTLLSLSGALLLVVGARVLIPDSTANAGRTVARLANTRLVVTACFAVGLLTGLLANGGGFLLVPMFMIILGLSAASASGTSMVAVGVLTIPSLVTHWALGHIDWKIAIVFAIGVWPGSMIGARLAQRLPEQITRRAFGLVLVTFAIWFLTKETL